MIDIKIAKTTDTEAIALLGRITYTESHGHFIDNKEDLLSYNNKAFAIQNISKELTDSNTVFYIIYVDKLPVGYGKLVLNANHKSVEETSMCRLEKIYILDDFIPLKIGQQFFNFIEKHAKELHFNTMWLTVYIKNQRGIKFYQKNNFKNVGDYNFMVNGKNYKNSVFSKKL